MMVVIFAALDPLWAQGALASSDSASVVLVPLMLTAAGPATQPATANPAYILGADDVISVWVFEAEELADRHAQIDAAGDINLPLVGRLHAGGLTVSQLEAELTRALQTYILEPKAVVTIVEFRSQPVSILGAVRDPGVHQLEGHKTLFEILSLAGGLRQDAGSKLKITRRKEWGAIPLPKASVDSSGEFSVAEVSLKEILEARNPGINIRIFPNDVISVPRADTVYVIGEVARPGGFQLDDHESLSVLQALSLAGGLGPTAARSARILRPSPGGKERTELAVNVKQILAGKSPDMPLQADDILFLPGSKSKKIALRAIEAAVSTGSGVVIWRSALP